jgi:ADP-ribose pyrophosphatase YjhB (NUDIX family)
MDVTPSSRSSDDSPFWLRTAREIQSLAQTGLVFSETGYDVKRYTRLTEIAAEITARHGLLEKEDVVRHFLSLPGYTTPKVDVRGAAIRDGQILLVRERSDGGWCMPGGWADVGEKPSEMVIREVWEESGFHVRVDKVAGVFDANRSRTPLEFHHAYKIVFLCEITGGEARPSDETSDVRFFDFDAVPPLSNDRTSERHLAEVLAHWREPGRPAAFD